jgi:Asp-tRNA(Asn)/Glu-tRNA(Gln) amidotransferase C subunit
MLTRMETDLATLRHVARLAGFDFTDAELEALRPGLERAQAQLARLEALPLAALEPATQYRMF